MKDTVSIKEKYLNSKLANSTGSLSFLSYYIYQGKFVVRVSVR